MSKISTIYKATNIINGKSYIGKTTKNFDWYKNGHIKNALRGDNKLFYKAIRKYGQKNFQWEILFEGECSNNKLNDLEIFYIGYYDTFNRSNGYNLTIGGDGFSPGLNSHMSRRFRTKEQRHKQSKLIAKIKSEKIDPETGLNMNQIGAIKASKTRNKKYNFRGQFNPYNQLSKEKRSETAKKVAETKRNTIDPETGLTLQEKYGKEHSKRLIERGSCAGKKNSSAKNFIITDPNGKIYKVHGFFTKFCNEHNLTGSCLRKFKNKPVPEPNPKFPKRITEKRKNTTGWMLEQIKN